MSLPLPYIPVKEFGIKDESGTLQSGILKTVKDDLQFSVLNYQYGYVEELNQTLEQWTKSDEFGSKKLPAVYIPQPFTIDRNNVNFYGDITFDILLFASTEKDWKAAERIERVFEPILYPLYLQILEAIKQSIIFDVQYFIPHKQTDFYYWENQDKYLTDKVDCLKMSDVKLRIKNKQCLPKTNINFLT